MVPLSLYRQTFDQFAVVLQNARSSTRRCNRTSHPRPRTVSPFLVRQRFHADVAKVHDAVRVVSLDRERTRADLAAGELRVLVVFRLFPIDGRLAVDLDSDVPADDFDVGL